MSVKEILQKHGFRFNKGFGQNFITDANLLSAIAADSGACPTDSVVEVGPGAGTLTAELARIAKDVLAIEIDTNLQPVLAETLAEFSNVTVRFTDFMKLPMEELDALGAYHVVANLPYYITTPVLFRFLEESRAVKSITVMVQKEVADRLCATPGSAEYGAVTVAVDYAGGARLMRKVPRQMFYPVPNVDSAVVRIDCAETCPRAKDEAHFRRLVKAGFAMRRKTLANNLISAFSMTREEVNAVLREAGFSESVRGETLSAADYVRLSDVMVLR